MTRFVGGPLDGWTEPTSPKEEAVMGDVLYPTVTLRKFKAGGESRMAIALDMLSNPLRNAATRIGEYRKWPADGRYYHESGFRARAVLGAMK